MTGPVDWTMLLFVLAALAAGAGGSWWMSTLMAAQRREMEGDFNIALAQTDAAHEKLEREFHEYKLHVAETYMSKMSGGGAIDRATIEMRGFRAEIKEDIDKLEKSFAARLDRLETRLFNGGPAGRA